MGNIVNKVTFAYARAMGISPKSRCFTLRQLSANPALQARCVSALVSKINNRSIKPEEFFRFDFNIIQAAALKAERAGLVKLAGKIERLPYLMLWQDKNCYFEPFYAGVARILLLYFILPEAEREAFLSAVEKKTSELVKESRQTRDNNLLFKWSRDNPLGALRGFVEHLELIGPRAYTPRARYIRRLHSPKGFQVQR